MQPEKNKNLEKYLLRIMELQAEKNENFSEEDLKNIALEMGLTEEEFLKTRKTAADAAERAKSYASVGKWEESEKEWQTALELEPFNPDFAVRFAQHKMYRWKKDGARRHLTDAEAWAMRALELAPSHAGALAILQKAQQRKSAKSIRKGFLYFVLVVMLAIAGLVGRVIWVESGMSYVKTGLEGLTYQVPLTFEEMPNGVTVETPGVSIVHSDSRYESRQFKLSGAAMLRPVKFELWDLQFEMEFYDAKGKLVAKDLYNALYKDRFKLRPGEVFLMRLDDVWSVPYKDAPVKIASAIFRFKSSTRYSPLAQYEESAQMPVEWRILKPKYLEFEARLRTQKQINTLEEDHTSLYEFMLVFQNKGTGNCRELKMLVKWLDPDGKIVDEQEVDLLPPGSPELKQGETLAFFLDKRFYPPAPYPIPFASVAVSVIHAD